ncbi:MAG: hypothetical protein ACTSRG_09440 [Candidatus Helarchaeota archaeon]
MSYYNKYTYTQSDKEYVAKESGTAITIVWVSKIINSTTIEISERDIETVLTIPINFTDIKTYQVNLITGKTNNSYGSFLFWTLPYWNIANLPSNTPLPISVGNNTYFTVSEQNIMVLQIIRNTKVAWSLGNNCISAANYDIYSGALIQYMGRIGNTVEIYQLQSTIGLNLGIDYKYYGLMVLLFSLIPALLVYILIIAINLRKKPQKARVRPLERRKENKENKISLNKMTNMEEK